MKTIIFEHQTVLLFSHYGIPITAADGLIDQLIEQLYRDSKLNKTETVTGLYPIKIHSLALMLRINCSKDEIVIEAENYPSGKANQYDCW